MLPAMQKHRRLSVEYNLTEHCNLSCYACDHASPLLPTKFTTVEAFSRDLEALAGVFHSEQLRIVGGEPLLHPQLLEFLTEARRIGIADAIVLITNGVLLPEMPAELWELIDQLWVSVYPGIKSKFDESKYTEICKAHDIHLMVWRVEDIQQNHHQRSHRRPCAGQKDFPRVQACRRDFLPYGA